MDHFPLDSALTEEELDQLEKVLKSSKSPHAMNLEELDGFFAALIAGPELVPPSEYLPEVFGGEMSETCEFESLEQARDALGLIMRHWNSIAGTLSRGDVHVPILLEDENGLSRANDWSRGFVRGVELRREEWAEVFDDDEQNGWMLPVLILCHEHDEDPELRPGPITPEKRDELILHMAAGVVKAYRYFRPERPKPGAAGHATQHRIKVGRNDRCPCGSGRKYKHCCGGSPVN